ncbi:MAG: hypothetical protein K6D96_04215 [Acetatifactor sp.]|nr:hypothetical protein [Acetatifactor sp.]
MYFLTGLIGFMFAMAWYMCHIRIRAFLAEKNLKILTILSPVISSFIPIAIIMFYMFNLDARMLRPIGWSEWATTFSTLCITVFIKWKSRDYDYFFSDTKMPDLVVEYALLELPDRMMLQTFVMLVIYTYGGNPYWGIYINALILAIVRLTDDILRKRKKKYRIISNIISGLIFSIGIGYVYYCTGAILYIVCARGAYIYILAKMNDWKDGHHTF